MFFPFSVELKVEQNMKKTLKNTIASLWEHLWFEFGHVCALVFVQVPSFPKKNMCVGLIGDS